MSRRLKVLYLIGRLTDDGGAERFALALATGLPEQRFQAIMCTTRGVDGLPARELASARVPYINLGRRTRLDAHRFASLVRLLRRERFDVIHAHMFGSNFWGALLGSLCHVPVVLAHEHTWSYEGNPVRVWVDGHVIGRLSTRFIAVSGADARRMVELEGVPEEKVIVMPTAYIPSQAAPDSDIRAELALPPDAPVMFTAIELRPQKAIDVLLDAHAMLIRQLPHAHLVIAGDGRQRAILEERARTLGIDHSVHFLGLRQDVDAILRVADVGVLSSDFEGMPLFMFECMANGTPLVSTAVGGVPDVVQSGVTGELVPPRDPAALADALLRLLRDPGRRRALAAAAAERLAPFRMEAVVERFAGLYETLHAEANR